jgi:hypothetical protein
MGNLPSPGRTSTGGGSNYANRSSGNRQGGGARPSTGARPNVGSRDRPSSADLNNFLDLGGPGGATGRPSNRPAYGGGTLSGGVLAGGAAAEFLHERPTTRPGGGSARPGEGVASTLPARPGGDDRPGRPGDGNRPGRPGDNNRPGRPSDRPGRPGGGDFAHDRPNRDPNWQNHQNWRQDRWKNVNNNWRNNWNVSRNWYGASWWNRYPGFPYRYYNGFNCWGWATWGVLTAWVPWSWNQPVYYNYGNNVYYEGDTVYYNNQPVATAAEYAQQAEAIATSIPDVTPAEDDWMPLGVFAISPDDQNSDVQPTLFLQLAVSKEGIISGSLQNTATGSVKPIEGMVDRETQRAAWTVVGQTRPLMETGIVNLTENTVPALVHFADDTTQQWLLVRLEQPK